VLYTLLPALWLCWPLRRNRDALFRSDLLSLKDFALFQNLHDLFTIDSGIYARWYVNSLLYAVLVRRSVPW